MFKDIVFQFCLLQVKYLQFNWYSFIWWNHYHLQSSLHFFRCCLTYLWPFKKGELRMEPNAPDVIWHGQSALGHLITKSYNSLNAAQSHCLFWLPHQCWLSSTLNSVKTFSPKIIITHAYLTCTCRVVYWWKVQMVTILLNLYPILFFKNPIPIFYCVKIYFGWIFFLTLC